MSKKVWNSLTPQVQAWVQEAADRSSQFQRALWKKKTVEALELVKAEGVTVFYPDPKDFQEKTRPMLARYEGTEIGNLIKRIEKEK